MIIAWDKQGFETRHESSGIFFLIIYIFNYTNEFLKVLRLRMETSWRQWRDMGAGDKSRARDASRVLRYFSNYIYIYYTNKFSKALYLRMETLGAAEKGYGN